MVSRKDPEKDKEYKAKWYRDNYERLKERYAKYRKEHPRDKEKEKESRRLYRLKHLEEEKEYGKKYRKDNPEYARECCKKYYRKRILKQPSWNRERAIDARYGLTLDSYNSMLEGQGGVCAICGSAEWTKKGPMIDHDHETGVVRGILCGNCNMAMGFSRDNKAIILKMYEYLDRAEKG